MTTETYEVVEHDGGWAYKAKGTFSETFPTHEAALAAATRAARLQTIGGETTPISWEDKDGKWHEEAADGGDRPVTKVEDSAGSKG